MPFPPLFEQRERALLGARFEELFCAPSAGPVRGATVNLLRCTPDRFAAAAGFAMEPSPFCPSAFVVKEPDWKPGRHPYHHAGVFYAQEPSAAAPAALLDVRPGMRVADLCAAPGGKTSQLAAALQGQGILLANEYVAARAEVLRQNLERMGVTNAVVTNEDTARLADALPGFFDRILVDAPCSGEGMFRKEAAAVAQYGQPLLDQCAALGAQILDNAARMLAPGGVMVYSTCTFAPGEDEGQVASFLDRHPEFSLCDLSDCGFGRPGEANRAGNLPFRRSSAAGSGRPTGEKGTLWPACKRPPMHRLRRPAASSPANLPNRIVNGWILRRSSSQRWSGIRSRRWGMGWFWPLTRSCLPHPCAFCAQGCRRAERSKSGLSRPTRCSWLTARNAPTGNC